MIFIEEEDSVATKERNNADTSKIIKAKLIKKRKRPSFAAILVTQGTFKFYIVAMPSEILGKTCFTITREEDPQLGFQRRYDVNRAEAIADYIDRGNGSIPTAIILSAQDEANLVYDSRTKTISFEEASLSFLIIDGQHRVWGFSKAEKSIRVPVVIYEELSRTEEARLFIDINSNQKEVPEALLLDVKRLLQNETEEEKKCSDLFELFYSDDRSVLKGRMVRAEKIKGKLSRITFNKAVSSILKGPFKDLAIEKSFSILNNYLSATNSIFDEIDDGLSNSLTKPVVFQGLLNASSHVIDKAISKHDKLTKEAFYNVLKVLKQNLRKHKIQNPGNSYVKFSEVIIEALTNVHIKSTIITEG